MIDESSIPSNADLPVGVGVQVEIECMDERGASECMVFQIVRENSADFERGFLSANTPLAKVLLGKRSGREIDYQMGDIRKVRILAVTPGTPPPADVAERRQAVLDNARRTAARTNAEMFAASYTGKWGDYEMADES